MAVDIFLKLTNNIAGEAQDHKHKDEIDVLAWSWGASQSGTMHVGGGGGSGKANFQDLSITKYLDKSSPLLLQACAKGTHIDQCDLVVRKAGDKPLEYMKITMKECLVSSYSTGGSGSEDRLTEHVSLNFAEFKVVYTTQKPDGTAGGEVPFGWSIQKNTSA